MRFPFITAGLKTVFISSLFISVLSACTKTDDGGGGSGNSYPLISSNNPTSFNTGATVTLGGSNFGTNPANVVVHLGNLAFTATSVNGTSIVFTVPTNLINYGSAVFNLYVVVNGISSNTIQVTVTYVYTEPRGWRYINKNMQYGPGIPAEIYFMDDPNQFGFAYGRGHLSSTSSDGAIWGGIWSQDHWGSAFHIYDQDEGWIETNTNDLLVYDYDYLNASAFYARLDTITTIPFLQGKAITGAFITKHKRGYIMTHDGSVFKINGSFKPADISLEFQPSIYTDLPLTYDNNNFYAFSGADSSNFLIAGRPKINGNMTPMIIHKRNGVYKEYFFSMADIGYPYQLQCPDANNAYFISLNYELYKFNVTTGSWTKLNTPKFSEICFLNGSLGYAASGWAPGQDYRYIYKTTDGGITWNVDFALDQFHYIYALCTRNGKVWGVGEETNFHKNFVIKFNP